MADDLRLLLDAMTIDRIAVVAHDWGGFASQLLTLDAPERVSRLLALSITPVIPVRRPPLRRLFMRTAGGDIGKLPRLLKGEAA